jgi:hypothetical protein
VVSFPALKEDTQDEEPQNARETHWRRHADEYFKKKSHSTRDEISRGMSPSIVGIEV